MANEKHAAFVARGRAIAAAAKAALEGAAAWVQEYQLLGYAPNGTDPIVSGDFEGTVADLTVADLAALVTAAGAIDSLLSANANTHRVALVKAAR